MLPQWPNPPAGISPQVKVVPGRRKDAVASTPLDTLIPTEVVEKAVRLIIFYWSFSFYLFCCFTKMSFHFEFCLSSFCNCLKGAYDTANHFTMIFCAWGDTFFSGFIWILACASLISTSSLFSKVWCNVSLFA